MEKVIHCDGGLVINPFLFNVSHPRGRATAKINFSPNDRMVLSLDSDDNTNNEAELFALLTAIIEAYKRGIKTIYSDSKLMVGIAMENYKVKEERLKLTASIIKRLVKEYQIEVKWCPREKLWAT
jgi:ribonuclease HI